MCGPRVGPWICAWAHSACSPPPPTPLPHSSILSVPSSTSSSLRRFYPGQTAASAWERNARMHSWTMLLPVLLALLLSCSSNNSSSKSGSGVCTRYERSSCSRHCGGKRYTKRISIGTKNTLATTKYTTSIHFEFDELHYFFFFF